MFPECTRRVNLVSTRSPFVLCTNTKGHNLWTMCTSLFKCCVQVRPVKHFFQSESYRQNQKIYGHHPLLIPEYPENYQEYPEKAEYPGNPDFPNIPDRICKVFRIFQTEFDEFSGYSGHGLMSLRIFCIFRTRFIRFSGYSGYSGLLDYFSVYPGNQVGWWPWMNQNWSFLSSQAMYMSHLQSLYFSLTLWVPSFFHNFSVISQTHG